MGRLVDSHVHVFADPLAALSRRLPLGPGAPAAVARARRLARVVLRPLSERFHEAQPKVSRWPEPLRAGIENVASLAAFSVGLVESSTDDLREAMAASGLEGAVVIAHPPAAPNELVLDAAVANPGLVPVVYVPPRAAAPARELADLAARGARGLKIHPAADGLGPDSGHYRALLGAAADLGLPVILHTGCIHLDYLYRDAHAASADRFVSWFADFRAVTFVLAHMNYEAPEVAIAIGRAHPNVVVDTSWQGTPAIADAIRTLGPERVLLGSDWPFGGRTIAVALRRAREAVAAAGLSAPDDEAVLGENAARIFGGPAR